MLTDALILAAQSGDRHAVNEFLAACVLVVRGVAMKTLVASNQMVDDAVQGSLQSAYTIDSTHATEAQALLRVDELIARGMVNMAKQRR